eukprot:11388995-Ditylum_brightwellii.AAC.1
MVKEKGGQESTDNVEVWSDDNLASSFPEPNEEGNTMEVEMDADPDEEEKMMEVEMDVEMPEGNETSQVFSPDTSKVSMVKEEAEKRLTVLKNLEVTVQKYQTATI